MSSSHRIREANSACTSLSRYPLLKASSMWHQGMRLRYARRFHHDQIGRPTCQWRNRRQWRETSFTRMLEAVFNGKIMSHLNYLTMMPHCDACRHHRHGRRNDSSDSRLVLGKHDLPRWHPRLDGHPVAKPDVHMPHTCARHDAFLSIAFASRSCTMPSAIIISHIGTHALRHPRRPADGHEKNTNRKPMGTEGRNA